MKELHWQAFSANVEGVFHSRPNRFVAMVETPQGLLRAHCPNPGRLRELLSPGTPVLLESPKGPSTLERSTALSLAAVQHKGLWVPMASARANQAVGIYLKEAFPLWKIQPEYTHGRSRFDYSMTQGDAQILTEVKACTLEHSGVAMFPDAPSLRATKHLEHLAELNKNPQVVFVTYFPEAKTLVPHLHTDPDFAQTALRLQHHIQFQALVWETDKTGASRLVNQALKVDLDPLVGIDYTQGLAIAAWESETQTVFAWGQDFPIWKKVLSQRAKVKQIMGESYGLMKVNDLRVFSHSSLSARWERESQERLHGKWQNQGMWKELIVEGRPLDTQGFWEWFLSYRHKYWKE